MLDGGYQNFDYDDDDHYNRKLGRFMYAALSLQLGVATLISLSTYYSHRMRNYLSDEEWLLTVSLIISGAILVLSICFKHFMRKHHRANFLLIAFAVSFGVFVACLTEFFEMKYILSAVLVANGIALGLTVYSFSSRKHFKPAAGLLVGVIVGALVLIFDFYYLIGFNLFIVLGYVAFIVIFSLHLVVNGQILTREDRYKLKHKHFALATLFLYIDYFGICC